MKRKPEHAEWDAIIDEITVDANGEDEQLWAFLHAFQSDVAVPCAGSVLGEPVTVSKFDYDGNGRRGLTVVCRRTDGRAYSVAVPDLVFAAHSKGGRYVAAYRRWMGLAPFQSDTAAPAIQKPTGGVVNSTVELAVLSVQQKSVYCRLLGGPQFVTLRAGRLRAAYPGEIVVVKPTKQWIYGGTLTLTGTIESARLDVPALGLTPLRWKRQGTWDPAQHYWGEKHDPIEEWAKPIIARGKRPQFEMEQVLPGYRSEDPDSDPIGQSNDLRDAYDDSGAYKILMDVCLADLRCLDAHAHLGNFHFDSRPKEAIRYYEAGYRIGELSLGENFNGVLPWGMIDNRPFLRCMNGFGLCLWRLRKFGDALRIFDRMLWLNPSDNQGVRFLIGAVRAKRSWQSSQDY